MGVVERRLGVVDAARAGDDEQAVVVAVEHRGDLLAAADHRRGALVAERELVEEGRRAATSSTTRSMRRSRTESLVRLLSMPAIIAGSPFLASRLPSLLVPLVQALAYGRGHGVRRRSPARWAEAAASRTPS